MVDQPTLDTPEQSSPTRNTSHDDDSVASNDLELVSPSTTLDLKGKTEVDVTTAKSDEDRAGIISTWMMFHLTPLLKLGATKHLYQEDCGVPSKIDSADYGNEMIMKSWEKELAKCEKYNKKLEEEEKLDLQIYGKRKKKRRRKNPSLTWAVLEAFGPFEFFLSMFYFFISSFFTFVPVLILEDLVQYFEGLAVGNNAHICFINPWVEVVGLGIFPMAVGILQTKSQVTMVHFSTFVRTTIAALVYKKSLKVSPTAKAMASSGKVFNLMSNDAVQLQKITMWLTLGLSCPFLVIISLVLIYRQVGRSTWIGVAVLIASFPINAVLFAAIGILRKKVLKQSDDRVSMMNELLNGIRIIKFYAWEKPYGKIVSESRVKEVKYLTYMAYVVAIGFSMTIVSIPIIQPILVFYSYTKWEKTPLSAAKAFSTLTLFAIMRFPFVVLPLALVAAAQCYIALCRIRAYLKLPERKDYIVHQPSPADEADEDSPGSQIGSVTMKDCSFAWIDPNGASTNSTSIESDQDSSMITLKNISCTIDAGSLVAVVGKVGCGKSSFLSAILGEMESVDDSKVYIPGGDQEEFLAYCPQVSIYSQFLSLFAF